MCYLNKLQNARFNDKDKKKHVPKKPTITKNFQLPEYKN